MTAPATHVALLRSINIGGRRLSMAELTAPLAPLGLVGLRTWQATGNLVLTAPDGPDPDVGALTVAIEDALRAGLGIEVPTIVRTADEIVATVAAMPFSQAQLAPTEGRVQCLFVREDPGAEVRAAVLAEHASDEDELVWGDGVLWWLPRRGVSTSSLRIGRVERAVGVATMRTHGAVAGLVAKHLAA